MESKFVENWEKELAMKRQFSRGFGCRFEPPKKEDAKFGRFFPLKGTPIDWRQYLPSGEQQENSFFCTSFAYLNCLETMIRYSGENFNFSDRWSAVRAKTAPNGNTIDNVCHAGLHEGNVKEEECFFKEEWLKDPNTYWKEIQDIENLNPSVIYPGPNYSIVRLNELKPALAYSPLIIGIQVGNTWSQEIITKPNEIYGGHAVELAYIDDYIYIFDSYPPFLKKLSLDYPVMVAKSLAKLPVNWKEINLKDQMTIMQKIIVLFNQLINMINASFSKTVKNTIITESEPVEPPTTPLEPPTVPLNEAKYCWEGIVAAKHSCRLIMDDFNLTWKEKNLLCAVIQAESGFNIKAKHDNGTSADWGICQINDFWWIGEDKYFKSVEEVLNEPEKSVRFMCESFKSGHLNRWCAYTNGSYKKFLV